MLSGAVFQKRTPKSCLKVLGNTSSERINNMIVNIVENSVGKEIIMSDDYEKATNMLRDFMFSVYVDSDAKSEESKAENLIKMLYTKLVEEPERLPDEFYNTVEEEGLIELYVTILLNERSICCKCI